MSGTNDLFVISKYGKYLYRMSKENIELTKVLHGLFKGDLPRLDENIHNGKLLYGQYVKYCENQDWDCFWKFEFDYKLLFGKPREVLNRIIDAVDEDVRKSQSSYSFYTNQANSVFDGLKKQFKVFKPNDLIYWLFVIFVLFILYRISTHWVWEWFGWILCFLAVVFLFYIYTLLNNMKFFGNGLYSLITGFLIFACYKIWIIWWIIKCIFYGIQWVVQQVVSPETFAYMLIISMVIVCAWVYLNYKKSVWLWVALGFFVFFCLFFGSLYFSRSPSGEILKEEMLEVNELYYLNETQSFIQFFKINFLNGFKPQRRVTSLWKAFFNSETQQQQQQQQQEECVVPNPKDEAERVNATIDCPVDKNNGTSEELARLSKLIEALSLKSDIHLSCPPPICASPNVTLSCPNLNKTDFNLSCPLPICPSPNVNLSCPNLNKTDFNLSCPIPNVTLSCPTINITNISCPASVCPKTNMIEFNQPINLSCPTVPVCPPPISKPACPSISVINLSFPNMDLVHVPTVTNILKQACPELDIVHVPIITEIQPQRFRNSSFHRPEDGGITEAMMNVIGALTGAFIDYQNWIVSASSIIGFRLAQVGLIHGSQHIMNHPKIPEHIKMSYGKWFCGWFAKIFGGWVMVRGPIAASGAM